jgi:hypothetical protein
MDHFVNYHKIFFLLKIHPIIHGVKIGNLDWFVNMVLVGAYKIPSLDNEYKNLKNEIANLEYKKERLQADVQALNNKTSTLRSVKCSYQQECDNKKEDIDYLNNHKEQLEDFVASFKSGNKRYLEIKGVAQEHVNYLLTQRKTMLTIAIIAVIEAMKMSPDRYMAIFVDGNKEDRWNDSESFASMYLKDAFSNYQTNQA